MHDRPLPILRLPKCRRASGPAYVSWLLTLMLVLSSCTSTSPAETGETLDGITGDALASPSASEHSPSPSSEPSPEPSSEPSPEPSHTPSPDPTAKPDLLLERALAQLRNDRSYRVRGSGKITVRPLPAPTPTPAPTLPPTPPPLPPSLDPLATPLPLTEPAVSVEPAPSATLAPGVITFFTFSAEVEEPGRFRQSISYRNSPEASGTIAEMVFIENRRWQRIQDLTGWQSLRSFDHPILSFDPRAPLRDLGALRKITESASEVVEGRLSRYLLASTDSAASQRAAVFADPTLLSLVRALDPALAGELDIWISIPDDRIRKSRSVIHGTLGKTVFTIEFESSYSRFGEPVIIDVPSDPTPTPFPSLAPPVAPAQAAPRATIVIPRATLSQ